MEASSQATTRVHRGHAHFDAGVQPHVIVARLDTDLSPFDLHLAGDCPADCPWCSAGGEG